MDREKGLDEGGRRGRGENIRNGEKENTGNKPGKGEIGIGKGGPRSIYVIYL